MLKSILSTATFKQSQITIIATIINGFLGLVFFITIARNIGAVNLGILTICITTLTLIADIADFGTNTGIVRFVSSNLVSNKDKAYKFLKLALEVKLFIWILVLLIGFFIAPLLAEIVFNKPELILPLRLTLVGVGGALLFSYATASLQAFQNYLSWGGINIATNFLRLLLIFILLYTTQISLINSLLIYITLPFFGSFLA